MTTLSDQSATYPTSPCIQVCTLDDAQVCLGCRRTLSEIVNWARMTAHEQRSVIEELATRGAASDTL